MSIQTALTRRNMSRRCLKRDGKRKNEEKEKVKKVFLIEEADRLDMKWGTWG
jgi:hypothetical protein